MMLKCYIDIEMDHDNLNIFFVYSRNVNNDFRKVLTRRLVKIYEVYKKIQMFENVSGHYDSANDAGLTIWDNGLIIILS